MAILVLLTASAGTRVVATDCLGSTERFPFRLFARVACGGCLLVGVAQILLLLLVTAHVLTFFGSGLAHFLRFLYRYLSAHQDGDGLVIDFVDHGVEQVD